MHIFFHFQTSTLWEKDIHTNSQKDKQPDSHQQSWNGWIWYAISGSCRVRQNQGTVQHPPVPRWLPGIRMGPFNAPLLSLSFFMSYLSKSIMWEVKTVLHFVVVVSHLPKLIMWEAKQCSFLSWSCRICRNPSSSGYPPIPVVGRTIHYGNLSLPGTTTS